jgi:nucleotide-binding universal stress UspA family protein
MKILIAIDGSDFSKRMLDYVAANAGWLGAGNDFTVLSVVSAVPPHAASAIAREQLQEYYADEADKVLAPVRGFMRRDGVAVQFVHRVGSAADTIAKLAAGEGFGLIVMGSHGHSAIANLVMGSVATKVLANCSVPVLLIR